MEQAHSSDLRLVSKMGTCFQHEKHSCSQHHPIAQSCSHGLVCCATQTTLPLEHGFLMSIADNTAACLYPFLNTLSEDTRER